MSYNVTTPTALFSGLWFADILLTMQFVGTDGHEMEENPFMKATIIHGGVAGFVLVKLLVLVLLLGMSKHIQPSIMWALCAMLAPVLIVSLIVVMGG